MIRKKLVLSIFILLGVTQIELNAAYSTELIKGGGNDTTKVDRKKWFNFGRTYGQQVRSYKSKLFIYASPKVKGSGLYQKVATQVGKTYTVSAILIGSDTNRRKRFNGASYLTISSTIPRKNESNVIASSSKIRGGEEQTVNFSFTARTAFSYIALRSENRYKYSSARFISLKEAQTTGTINTETPTTPPVTTPPPVVVPPTTTNTSLTASNPIVVNNNNIVIENKTFRGNGNNVGITIKGKSNITIRNCRFINFKYGIFIYKSKNITMTGNRFENGFTSIRALVSSDIHVLKNEALNIGHTKIGPRANFVTFDKIEGGSIKNNRVENQAGQSNYVEDVISVYKSHGKQGNPILVEGNWLRGQGTSHSSSCIMTGDNSGTYILTRNNIGVNCGQVGMGIAGGSNNELSNNIIVHTKTNYFSRVGIYAVDYKGYGGTNNVIKNNKINFWSSSHKIYYGSWVKNLGVSISGNTGFGIYKQDTSVDASALPSDLFQNSDTAYFTTRNK